MEAETILVRTARGSAYLVDAARRELIRLPREFPIDLQIADAVANLRRDGTVLELLEARMALGHPAMFLTPGASEDPHVATLRRTTTVVELRALAGARNGEVQ